jgi:biotin carboxylase
VDETAALALSLGLEGLDADATARVTDKHLQRQALSESISARSFALSSLYDWDFAAHELGGRAVIKPRRSAGSRDTYLVEDFAQGRRTLARYADDDSMLEPLFVAEEVLVGGRPEGEADYVSVESAAQQGCITHIQITGKFPLLPPFREVGQFWPASLPAGLREQIERTVTLALGSLGFRTGIAHTELKLTPAGPRVIEVNGRLVRQSPVGF